MATLTIDAPARRPLIRRHLQLALALAAIAAAMMSCSPEHRLQPNLDPSWPDVASFYRVANGAVECDGPHEIRTDNDGNRISCVWNRVTVDGEPRCSAIVIFTRDATDAPWAEPIVFVTHGNYCPPE